MFSKLVNDAERKRSMNKDGKVPDFLKTAAEKENKKENTKQKTFTERVEKAMKYGWKLDQVGSMWWIVPPSHFGAKTKVRSEKSIL